MIKPIDQLPWDQQIPALNENGFTLISSVLDPEECDQLIACYQNDQLFRKKVIMERHRFGKGEYQYFAYPLPNLVENLRSKVYPHLYRLANQWMEHLGKDTCFPAAHPDFIESCHENHQRQPTPLLLKYGPGDFNTLHQDLYGEVFFPLQLVCFLSEPDKDYTGGEFVITEQVPRAQSKVRVLRPGKGDALIFSTCYRPVRGTRGYYRTQLRHGVSEVHSGSRYTLGIIFHDATN